VSTQQLNQRDYKMLNKFKTHVRMIYYVLTKRSCVIIKDVNNVPDGCYEVVPDSVCRIEIGEVDVFVKGDKVEL